MPVNVETRPRVYHSLVLQNHTPQHGHHVEYSVELCFVAANSMFLAGSALFLSAETTVLGAELFLIGSIIFVILSWVNMREQRAYDDFSFTEMSEKLVLGAHLLPESVDANPLQRIGSVERVLENVCYMFGSLCFALGSSLYIHRFMRIKEVSAVVGCGCRLWLWWWWWGRVEPRGYIYGGGHAQPRTHSRRLLARIVACALYVAAGSMLRTDSCTHRASEDPEQPAIHSSALSLTEMRFLTPLPSSSPLLHIFSQDEEWGSWLFVVGSISFVLATFFNGLGMTAAYLDPSLPPSIAVTAYHLAATGLCCTQLASVFFCVGSFLYRPGLDTECNQRDDNVCVSASLEGTWLYVVGSVLYLTQSCLNIVSARLKHRAQARAHLGQLAGGGDEDDESNGGAGGDDAAVRRRFQV